MNRMCRHIWFAVLLCFIFKHPYSHARSSNCETLLERMTAHLPEHDEVVFLDDGTKVFSHFRSNVNKDNISRIYNLINDLNYMIDGSDYLVSPKSIILEIDGLGREAYYQKNKYHTVRLPQRYSQPFPRSGLRNHVEKGTRLRMKNYFKHPKYSDAIHTHEYGHLIFYATLNGKDKIVDYFLEHEMVLLFLQRDNEKLTNEIDELFFDSTKMGGTDPSVDEKMFTLERQVEANLMYIDDISSKTKTIFGSRNSSFFYMAAYSDLFADLFAMLYFNDPHIIVKAILQTKEKQFKYNEMGVDVFFRRDPADRRNKLELTYRYNKGINPLSPQETFGPTLYFLNTYLKMPRFQTEQGKEELLTIILKSIEHELERRWMYRTYGPTLYEVNEDLIAVIKKNLASLLND